MEMNGLLTVKRCGPPWPISLTTFSSSPEQTQMFPNIRVNVLHCPLNAEGIEIQPVHTMGTERSNATFYDDVRIGDEWRIGDVDGGWEIMKAALKYERGIAGGQFPSPPLIDAFIDYANKTNAPDGSLIIKNPVVRERVVRALIDVEVCRGFAYNTAFLASEGVMFGVEGSMTKLFASESYKKHSKWFIDMAGADGLLYLGEEDAPVGGVIDEHFRHAPVTTIYGGTSEIAESNCRRPLGFPNTVNRSMYEFEDVNTADIRYLIGVPSYLQQSQCSPSSPHASGKRLKYL